MRRRALLVVGAVAAVLALDAAPAFAQVAGDPSSTTILFKVLAVAGGALAFALLLYLIFARDSAVESNLRERLGAYGAAQADRGILAAFPFLRRFARGAEQVAERRGFRQQIETALEQADLPLRVGEAIMAAGGIALVIGAIVGLVTQNFTIALVVVAVTMVVAMVSVQVVASRERKKFESQLPDTLNLISTSLRAGYSLLQALEAVASEAPNPTSREFGRALSEVRLGRSPTDALKEIAARMESVDFDWVVLAIDIQREVGGNLAEVLQTSAETMQHRNRLRREIRALTAEGRVSAFVLGGLPFGLFAWLFVTNRSYLSPLFSSLWGIVSLVGALLLMVLGVVWLIRIVKVEL